MLARAILSAVIMLATAALLGCGDDGGSGDGSSATRQVFERSIDTTAAREFGLTANETACVKRRLRDSVTDDQIDALPAGQGGLREPDDAMRLAVAKAIGACEPGPGPKLNTLDRFNFEAGLRNGLSKSRPDLTEPQLDCIVVRLRRRVSDDKLGASTEAAQQELREQLVAALAACA